jgi:hypothetical protein
MLTDRVASPPAWTQRSHVQVRRHRACEVERPLLWSWREERIPQGVLIFESVIAAEPFMNNAGQINPMAAF